MRIRQDAATRPAERRLSSRALSAAERERIHALLDSERFADLSPREVYATLLDEGVYHCSWSTMYQLLRERGETRRRRDQPQPTTYSKPELLATEPRQLWSWDITVRREVASVIAPRVITRMEPVVPPTVPLGGEAAR